MMQPHANHHTGPRMADKLLQHIMFECARHKVTMPWDAIAHRFHPGSSGTAIIQHLNRTRKELIAEGHLVPPMAHGAEATQDPNVRGYIRKDSDGSDCETTRPVLFNENVDDLRVNLPCGVVTDDDMETSTQLNTPDEEHSENESSPNPLLASSLWPTLYSTPTKRRGATPQQYNPVEMAGQVCSTLTMQQITELTGQSMDSYLTSPSVMRHGEMNDERYVAPPSFPGHSDGGSFSSFGQFDHNGGQFLGCNDPFDFQLEEYTPDDSGSGTDNSFVGNGQMLIEHAVTTDSDSGSPANMGSVELSTQDVTPGLADFLVRFKETVLTCSTALTHSE